MKIQRIVKRSWFYVQKFLLDYLSYFDHRIYMNLYNKLLRKNGMKLSGSPRFIAKSVRFDDFDKIEIGDRAIISMNVHFLTHDYSFTTAAYAANNPPKTDTEIVKNIKIGSNVFIGMNVILLPGTEVGNNVIIGAGSVVRGTIPEFALVIGNPFQIVGDTRDYYSKTIMNKKNIFRSDKV